MICVDSDFCIALLKGDEEAERIMQRIEFEGTVYITSISVFEILYVTKNLKRSRQVATEKLIRSLEVLPFDYKSAVKAGDIGAKLAKKGEMIGVKDLFIGAIALTNGCKLVTKNVKHFKKIDGVEIIEW